MPSPFKSLQITKRDDNKINSKLIITTAGCCGCGKFAKRTGYINGACGSGQGSPP